MTSLTNEQILINIFKKQNEDRYFQYLAEGREFIELVNLQKTGTTTEQALEWVKKNEFSVIPPEGYRLNANQAIIGWEKIC